MQRRAVSGDSRTRTAHTDQQGIARDTCSPSTRRLHTAYSCRVPCGCGACDTGDSECKRKCRLYRGLTDDGMMSPPDRHISDGHPRRPHKLPASPPRLFKTCLDLSTGNTALEMAFEVSQRRLDRLSSGAGEMYDLQRSQQQQAATHVSFDKSAAARSLRLPSAARVMSAQWSKSRAAGSSRAGLPAAPLAYPPLRRMCLHRSTRRLDCSFLRRMAAWKGGGMWLGSAGV